MNNARVAQLLRSIARLHEDLAEEIDPRAESPEEVPKRKRSRAVLPVIPASKPSEVDRARAREELRKLGYR